MTRGGWSVYPEKSSGGNRKTASKEKRKTPSLQLAAEGRALRCAAGDFQAVGERGLGGSRRREIP